MTPLLKRPWFIALLVIVAAVLLLAVVMGNLRLRSAGSRLPERGTVVEPVAGCPAPVEVLIDGRGIPHVRAEDDRAAWFAQGYLHARDRFFQMELARRLAAGRLAELFGRSALTRDRNMRTLRVAASARRQVVRLSVGERRALDSYAAGVNAALERFGRWISPEIWLLGVHPEPWQPEDSLRIGVLFQLSLSWAMGEELERAVEFAGLGRDRALDLWGWSPSEARQWIPPGDHLSTPLRPDEAILPPVHLMGSNAWAVAPRRSATGRPLLANDPHLGVQMPGVWYAVHLRAPGLHVAGLSLAGAPGVVVGHTEQVAWGLTNAMVDDQDLYRVTLDETGGRELIDGTWQPLRTVTERIHVRWQPEPVLVKIRLSERGPLVREGRREVLALSWAGLYGPNPLRAVLEMDTAQSAQDIARAWEGVHGPALTVVAADVDGHIVRQTVGSEPRRGRGAGRLPAPAADSEWAWRGFRPLADRLVEPDPAQGFVAAANHDPFSEGDLASSLAVPGEYDAPWRIRRIRRALAGRDDWDLAGFLDLQADVVSELAVVTLKQLWSDFERTGGTTAERLLAWDGRMGAGEIEPHLFARFLLELSSQIGADEARQGRLDHNPIGGSEISRLLAGGLDESWWDDVATAEVENRQRIVAWTLHQVDALRLEPRWGQVHRVTFAHPFGQIPVIGRFVGRSWSRGPFAVGGDSVTVNAHYWRRERPFDVIAMPSARFVADVGNWDATVLVTPPGQSGRPWSSHYDDQVAPWLRVAGVTLPFSDGAVDAAARSRLVLEPVIQRDE